MKNKNNIIIAILCLSAAVLVGLNLGSGSNSAQAGVVVVGRDYQAVTARSRNGGEALYILDNKTGQLAVFLYDTKDRTVRVRDVRMVRDAFAGR